MLKRETIENVLIVAAKKEGYSLNGQDRLMMRMRVSSAMDNQKRLHLQLSTGNFQWKMPKPPRN